MFEKLRESIKKFARGIGSKEEIEKLVREIQVELIKSDVEIGLVHELSRRIKRKLFEEKIPDGVTRREHAIKTIYEEISGILGSKGELSISKGKILLMGLYGSGKTTTAGKMANFFRKMGLKPGLISLDVHRPAAQEQLEQIAKKVHAEYYKGEKLEDLINEGFEFLKRRGCDLIIIDSAGRDSLDKDLLEELKHISERANPERKILVISGDIGQSAGNMAKKFGEVIGIDGVIITKMDSSARGGGALTSCFYSNAKVIFIGTGEKPEDFEIYNPEKFVSRMLGFSDIKEVMEKFTQQADLEKAEKFIEGEFDLEDFCEQMSTTFKSGFINQITNFLPFGWKKLESEFGFAEEKIRKFKYIFDSMTKEERKRPEILNSSRIIRIAKGSGTQEQDVRELLKLYHQAKKMSKKIGKLRGRNLRTLMKNFPGFEL